MQRKDHDHREIMDAVLARDVERASRAVEQHIRRTVDVALKHVPGLNVLKERPGGALKPLVGARPTNATTRRARG
jgi:hypothetical protein